MRLLALLLSLTLAVGVARAVSILRLEVPAVVQANSSAVVLDCDYQVDEWERPGLVVKWYLDKIHLVYQWIPPSPPQALGVLAGRVDTAYRATRDPWAAHRALYIPRPHPAHSGQFCCTVSTFEDEDWRTATMLVWTPPQHLDVRLWRPSEHLVNLTCTALGSAPRPEFHLYTRDANGTRQEQVAVRGSHGRRDEGVWAAGAWGLLLWEETEPGTEVGCTVTLPGTQYTETLSTVYHADLPIITTTTTTTTTTTPAPTTTTTFGLLHPRSNLSKDGGGPATTVTSFFDFPSLFGSASTSGGKRPDLWSGCPVLLLFVAEMWRMWDVAL